MAGKRVRVIGRAGCHLCEDAEAIVAAVSAELGVGWESVPIDEHPELLRSYAEQIPVILVDGAEHAYWRVDADALRAALAGRSRWSLRRR